RDVDVLARNVGAGQRPRLQRFAGVENRGGRIGHSTSRADDVHVLVLAFARRGVVVIEREGVRLGRVQEVDDLAVLNGALRHADLIQRLRWRRRVRRRRGGGRLAAGHIATLNDDGRVLQRPRVDLDRYVAGIEVHEARRDPSVAFLDHLHRDVCADELEPLRQHDGVPPDAQRPLEDDGVTVAEVARRVLVGLENPGARRARGWPPAWPRVAGGGGGGSGGGGPPPHARPARRPP